ncbi:DUF1492 domain-containing protein [Ruminococcaceae bacterium OttesenSCG-928-I18]|nr:DUF1492 domain-containing protein [Ruminococcaceae bacterium OttesenSCG-928-I18]
MTKDELNRVRKMGIAIKAKQMEAEFLRDIAGKATSTISATKASGTSRRSRVEDAVVALVDLEVEIDQQILEFKDIRLQAAMEINKLKSTEERVVLQMRYLACRKWEDIADDLGYSVQHIYRLHGCALEKMRVNESKKCDKVYVGKSPHSDAEETDHDS